MERRELLMDTGVEGLGGTTCPWGEWEIINDQWSTISF